jgi:hypothetical protein
MRVTFDVANDSSDVANDSRKNRRQAVAVDVLIEPLR